LNWGSAFPHETTLTIAALIVASPALAARCPPGQLYRVRLAECVSLSSPLPVDKADDLESIKKAVDDAASVGGALWLSYLFVLFYLAVATGAVTHADLFFENPVKLPFLNIELPLLAFFFLAPILFIIVHAYTLVHLVFLTDKTKRFHKALHDPARGVTAATRENLQWQLPSNIFIQFLAGPPERRERAFGLLLRLVACVTLVIAPVLLLLLMRVQFLPFHSSFITWTHRLVLLADLCLIWWLWRTIMSGREGSERRSASWAWTGLGALFSAFAFLFSWLETTFPGEWHDNRLAAWQVFPTTDVAGRPIKVSFHDWLFNSKFDPKTGGRWLPVSSTLVLTGLNIYEGLGMDGPDKAKWREYVFRARGRDLRGAIFNFAILPKVDFEFAQLQGASLDVAQLQGASLGSAQLRGASLNSARLEGASLTYAQLQGASLRGAQFQGASLQSAQLEGASLDFALLQDASLEDARLQGASLDYAQLQGASLRDAELQGASLGSAQLRGASLDNAQLLGASLDHAQLQGASLVRAQLQGASFDYAQLDVTDLSYAFLWRTRGEKASVTAVMLPVDSLFDMETGERWRPLWVDEGKTQPWNVQ
jgi:uncharacterized protein YjbI with pentapeptide repeats